MLLKCKQAANRSAAGYAACGLCLCKDHIGGVSLHNTRADTKLASQLAFKTFAC